jgi:GT2 family glycosyltransferase
MVRDQDDEYNYRIRKLGGRLLLAGDVHSRYYSRASLKSLWKQYFGYGYWKARVLWKHPKQMSPRQFIPAIFVGCLAAGFILSPVSRTARKLFWTTLLSYAGVSAAASYKTASESDMQYLSKLPLAFAALHLSYGSGFLVGNARLLLDQWRRSRQEEQEEVDE